MITVGIIGCGFVGSALKMWQEEHNPDVRIVASDPPKGMNDDISGADIYSCRSTSRRKRAARRT